MELPTLLKNPTRPAGVTAIALVLFAGAIGSIATAVATSSGAWPLASGRWLVGDLVTMGPILFVVAAAAYAVIGFGLLRMKNWARRLAIVVAVAGLYFVVPVVSSAVADLRIGAIATSGAQIILRVVVLWYFFQERVGSEFGR